MRLDSVLVDTGSESSIFEADLLRPLGVVPGEDEVLQIVYGVGGVESVYAGRLDAIRIGDHEFGPVDIDVGRTGHGFGIDAILGMDFLDRNRAIVDLPGRVLRFDL